MLSELSLGRVGCCPGGLLVASGAVDETSEDKRGNKQNSGMGVVSDS